MFYGKVTNESAIPRWSKTLRAFAVRVAKRFCHIPVNALVHHGGKVYKLLVEVLLLRLPHPSQLQKGLQY